MVRAVALKKLPLRRKKMGEQAVCKCGKGHASRYDGMCCFCREKLFSRSEAKAVCVRTRGDGMSVDQFKVAKGIVKRSSVYL